MIKCNNLKSGERIIHFIIIVYTAVFFNRFFPCIHRPAAERVFLL